LNTAAVILALTPTILAGIGPTVTKISLLSLHRPFLALSLSLGSPGFFLSRPTIYDNPFEITNNDFGRLIVPRQRFSWLISTLQYLLACGAVGNVLFTSYDFGHRSVLTYSREISFYQLWWSASIVGPFLLSFLSIRLAVP
jgi:hypothetical protein